MSVFVGRCHFCYSHISLCYACNKIHVYFMLMLVFIYIGPFSGTVVPLWTGLVEDNYICVW